MDLVSFESPEEYRHFAKIMFRGKHYLVEIFVVVG